MLCKYSKFIKFNKKDNKKSSTVTALKKQKRKNKYLK